MPARSLLYFLPEEIKEQLDKKLRENQFSKYLEIRDWLEEQGYKVCYSTLARYGKQFKDYIENLRETADKAKAIVEETSDDRNAFAEALSQAIQHKLLDVVIKQDLDNTELAKIAVAAAKINNASVAIKKYKQEATLRAQQVAEEVKKQQIAGGLSEETADKIIEQIWGIVTD